MMKRCHQWLHQKAKYLLRLCYYRVDLALVHADALKFLADRWDEMEPNNRFPITLFNRTEVIDIEQIEFLLSLA